MKRSGPQDIYFTCGQINRRSIRVKPHLPAQIQFYLFFDQCHRCPNFRTLARPRGSSCLNPDYRCSLPAYCPANFTDHYKFLRTPRGWYVDLCATFKSRLLDIIGELLLSSCLTHSLKYAYC